MNELEQKLAEVQLAALKLQHLLLASQLKSGGFNPNRDELGRFASGGGGGGADLESFAASHGGRMENGMLVITAPKLLSSGSTEAGPSKREVETLEDGAATVSRRSGSFYLDSEAGSRKLGSNEELTILGIT